MGYFSVKIISDHYMEPVFSLGHRLVEVGGVVLIVFNNDPILDVVKLFPKLRE